MRCKYVGVFVLGENAMTGSSTSATTRLAQGVALHRFISSRQQNHIGKKHFGERFWGRVWCLGGVLRKALGKGFQIDFEVNVEMTRAICFLEAFWGSWHPVGAILGPSWLPKRSQEGQKAIQKSIKITMPFGIYFWIDSG